MMGEETGVPKENPDVGERTANPAHTVPRPRIDPRRIDTSTAPSAHQH